MAQDFTVDRNSPKWVLGADGYLKEYTTDQAAIEFNADGSYKGVLVEPAATNICLQSENLSATWGPSGATITANNTTAPDGNATADKFGDDNRGGTGEVVIYQTITGLTGGAKYTASAFFKKDTVDWVRFRAVGIDGGTNAGRYFNIDAGTLGSESNLYDSSIEAYPNGWYKCSITWTQGAADTSFALYLYLCNGDGDITVPVDGTSSIFVWGAQVEASPIATSYIPTTTGAVTRLKDDIYLTSASSLIGQTEGTLFVEVDWQLTSGTTQILLGATDASFNNGFRIYNDSSPVNLIMRARAGGVDLTVQGEASTAYTGIQKIAFAYAENDFELYRNGSSISSDTSGSLSALATVTDIDFGQSSGATAQANMWIRAVALFTTRLSDAEAYSLTGYDTYAQMANALQYTIL